MIPRSEGDGMNGESSLDAFFGPRADETPLGMVVGGSLSSGLLVRLDARLSIERLAVGRYIVIQGTSGRKFFGLITDIALDSTNPDLMRQPSAPGDAFAAEVYARQVAFGTLSVSPMLMLDPEDDQPRPNKTVPAHFAPVHEASAEDVERVFGAEDEKHLFLGTPLDMQAVHVNLDGTGERAADFREINAGLSSAEALEEAKRCFNCGVCSLCDNCFIFCPDMAIAARPDKQGYEINLEYCKGCCICVEECPRGAISVEVRK